MLLAFLIYTPYKLFITFSYKFNNVYGTIMIYPSLALSFILLPNSGS